MGANAPRHKAMSYGRMKEKQGQLVEEAVELLRKAQEVDDIEDRRYDKDSRGLAEAEQAEKEGRNHPGRLLMSGRSGTSPAMTHASCQAREGGTSSSHTTVRRWWTASVR